MLVQHARISLDRPVGKWVCAALGADGRTRALAPDADIAVQAALLGGEGLHGTRPTGSSNATTRARGATLVTRDQALLRFDPQHTAW